MIHQALVLKNYFPKRNKVTIFHEKLGVISFYVHEKQQASFLCNGSLIYCNIKKQQSSYQCDFVDAYYVPFNSATCDLYFIHDVLKLSLLFFPTATAMPEVFMIIMSLYEGLENLSTQQKKIYLLKIFLYIGVFPENKKLYQIVMQEYRLYSKDVDILLNKSLDYCWNGD